MPMEYGGAARYAGGSLNQFKAGFFDAPAVLKLMDRVTAKALSKFGAFVRRRAQTSIKYRNRASSPGSPPSAHRTMTRAKTNKRTGLTKKQDVSPLREFILFAYEPKTKAVVIGPVATNQVFFDGDRKPVRGTVPAVLEEGGEIGVLEVLKFGRWRRMDLRSRRRAAGLPQRYRTVTIRARPYMLPAFEAELPQLITFFHSNAL